MVESLEQETTSNISSYSKLVYTRNVIACIPAYNEEESIFDVIKATENFVKKVLVCNDGSIDNTSEVVKKTQATLLSQEKKMGKGFTLRTLFREAIKLDPEVIITLDADNQHNPSDIPVLLKEIMRNGSDIVVGSRFVKGAHTDISKWRLFGLNVINYLQNALTNCSVIDSQSGFRAFTKDAFSVVLESREDGYTIESEQLFLAAEKGIKVTEVPITVKYKGLHSTSKKNFIVHGLELVNYILRYYIKKRF